MLDFKKHASFRNFVKLCAEIGDNHLNVHFGSQLHRNDSAITDILKQPKFNKIIRLENLTQELDKIAATFGKKVEIPVVNGCNYKNPLTIPMWDIDIREHIKKHGFVFPDWKYFLDDEIRAIAKRLFPRDFQLYQLSSLTDSSRELQELLSPEETDKSELVRGEGLMIPLIDDIHKIIYF